MWSESGPAIASERCYDVDETLTRVFTLWARHTTTGRVLEHHIDLIPI